METLLNYIGVYVGIVFGITALVCVISKKRNRPVSPYLVFGVTDIICGLIIAGFSLWDILTPGGDLNGLLGHLLLMIYAPTAVVLLIADLIVWRLHSR